jgi:uncharacterized protein (TIGR04206 family)
MVWVKSEYAEELAVLLTWLSALVPWSISYGSFAVTSGQDLTLVILRFPFVGIRYQLGVQVLGGTSVLTPLEFRQEVQNAGGNALAQVPGYDLWLVGLAVLTVAVAVSLLMYFEVESALDVIPVDPVRLLGALLLVVAIALLSSTYVLYTSQAALFVPFGVFLHLAFGVILLRVDRAEAENPDADADTA